MTLYVPRSKLDKWDERMLQVAEVIATWSKDPDAQVGCVISSDDMRYIAWGFNGFPVGVKDDDRLKDKVLKNSLMVHAEANAIVNSRTDLGGCFLFATKPPCIECAKLAIQAGIERVICPRPDQKSRWLESSRKGKLLLKEAGVDVTWYIDGE